MNTAGTAVSPNLNSNVVPLKTSLCSLVQASTAVMNGGWRGGGVATSSDRIVVGAGKNGRVGAERGTALPGSRGLTPLTFVVLFHQVRLDVSVVRTSHDHRSRDDQGQSPGECEHGARSALPLLVHDEVLATCTRTRVPTPWARGLSPGARSIHDLLSRAPVSPHDPSLLASRAAPRASTSASVPRHSLNVRHFHGPRCAPRKRASGAPPSRSALTPAPRPIPKPHASR